MTRHRITAFRNALLNVITTQFGISAQVQVRSGANATTGGQGVLLAQLTGNVTAWAAAAAGGVLTSNAITADSSADATGTAAHYQINTSGGVFQESGLIPGDGPTIDNSSIVAGQTVQMSGTWNYTDPDA